MSQNQVKPILNIDINIFIIKIPYIYHIFDIIVTWINC